jgi:predicted DCC family thiol-disulfide oxidoreductase YuxK
MTDATDAPVALLTVFYDGSCGLCSAEMHELQALDRDGLLRLVDCAAPDFDDAPHRAHGITREAMLNALHVRDALGEWHVGIDAVAAVYAAVGLRRLAQLWTHPWLKPATARAYAWLVRHRHGLSRLGADRVMPAVLRAGMLALPQRCRGGLCETRSAPLR